MNDSPVSDLTAFDLFLGFKYPVKKVHAKLKGRDAGRRSILPFVKTKEYGQGEAGDSYHAVTFKEFGRARGRRI